MEIKETIGIDVSKATLDASIHSNKRSATFENTEKGMSLLVKWVLANTVHPRAMIFFAFEHTGLYSERLSEFLSNNKLPFSIIPGLEIKRSLGISRGKDDRVDAEKIAIYAYKLREEIQPSQVAPKEIRTLKKLLSLRERLVRQRAGYKASLKEQKKVFGKEMPKLLLGVQKKMIKELSVQIDAIGTEMEAIISSDREMARKFELLLSIKCIGNQAALHLMVFTEGFTKFKNSRQFASYCGVAPFPNQSGTSLKGRPRISQLANKKMKSLLDMCAKSSIRHNLEIREYYQRRVAMGKNKMSTINIIRNKLLSRVFAVIQRGTPYVNLYGHIT